MIEQCFSYNFSIRPLIYLILQIHKLRTDLSPVSTASSPVQHSATIMPTSTSASPASVAHNLTVASGGMCDLDFGRGFESCAGDAPVGWNSPLSKAALVRAAYCSMIFASWPSGTARLGDSVAAPRSDCARRLRIGYEGVRARTACKSGEIASTYWSIQFQRMKNVPSGRLASTNASPAVYPNPGQFVH